MNVALRRPMTVDSFLIWEEDQELRDIATLSGADAVLVLPAIEIEIALAELYADVGLAPDERANTLPAVEDRLP